VGKVGEELTVEQGYEASKYVGLNLLATLKHNLGDLDKIKRVVKLFGLVNCVNGFGQQPAVINGCSDLMVKVFGENGNHVRSAVGTNSLPYGVAVEIEAIFEIHPKATTTTSTLAAAAAPVAVPVAVAVSEGTPDSK
jgi:enamine deaminase RidA (YjgF/YER057c/UK114 family)